MGARSRRSRWSALRRLRESRVAAVKSRQSKLRFGWQSRPTGAMSSPSRLVCRVEVPPKRATPPGRSPAAREGQCRRDSGFERVGSFFALAFCGRERQAHFLPDCSGQEPANGMWLPARGFHQLFQSGTAGPLQQIQDLGCFAALAGAIGRLRQFRTLWLFSPLLGRGGHLSRLGLAGRNTGLPWRGVGRFGGLRRPGQGRLGGPVLQYSASSS